jgi:iron complex transport system permease protein
MTTPADALSPSPDGGNGPSGAGGMGRYLLVLAFLGLLTAGLFVASLFTGRSPGTLLDLFLGVAVDDPQTLWLIFSEIRLPRALLATVVGATLGLAGAALQGYLRNPLAEPGLVGASSTAALGAVLMLYTGASTWFPMALPLGGIAGAIIGLALVTLLAGSSSGALTLILAGVAINTLAAALTSLALNLAPSPYAALEIIFWLLGSLADRSFEHLRVALPFMLVGWALMLRLGRALDALSIGEEAASSLGFRLSRLRLLLLLGVGLSVGAAVAVSGAIGFIGLFPEPSASSAWWCHIFCAPWWATVPARCCRRAHWAAPPCPWPPTSACACCRRVRNSSWVF